jgi:hypothetical protein
MLKKRLGVLLWSNNLWYLSEGLLGATMVFFGQKVGGDLLNLSWAGALYYAANGLVEFMVGRFSRSEIVMERVMIVGFILNTIATFSFCWVETMYTFFLVQMIIGISRGLAGPTWDALYQMANTTDHVADAWGRSRGFGSMFMAISIILCGYLVKESEQRFDRAFIIMGIIQAAATLVLWSIVRLRTPCRPGSA